MRSSGQSLRPETPRRAATTRFSRTERFAKMARPFGHVGHAPAGNAIGRRVRRVLSADRDASARRAQHVPSASGSASSCPCRCARAGRRPRRRAPPAKRRAARGSRRSGRAGPSLRPGAPRQDLMDLTQIRKLHFRIGAHGRGNVARDHGAVDHHGDAVGHAEHRVHVVLDQQDGVSRLEARQQFEHALRFLGAHARERLVQQQHARPSWRRTSRFPAAAFRRAKAVRRCGPRALPDLSCSSASRASPVLAGHAAAGVHQFHGNLVRRLRGEPAILEHRKARKDRRALVAAPKSGTRAPAVATSA